MSLKGIAKETLGILEARRYTNSQGLPVDLGDALESAIRRTRLYRPEAAALLLERILWMARDPRPFVEAGDYIGPDRRFRDEDLPEGMEERRADRIRPPAANTGEAES